MQIDDDFFRALERALVLATDMALDPHEARVLLSRVRRTALELEFPAPLKASAQPTPFRWVRSPGNPWHRCRAADIRDQDQGSAVACGFHVQVTAIDPGAFPTEGAVCWACRDTGAAPPDIPARDLPSMVDQEVLDCLVQLVNQTCSSTCTGARGCTGLCLRRRMACMWVAGVVAARSA